MLLWTEVLSKTWKECKCKQSVALLKISVYIGFAHKQNYTIGLEKKISSGIETCNRNFSSYHAIDSATAISKGPMYYH